MELSTNLHSLDFQIKSLIESYVHSQHSLFDTRRDLARELFEQGNIKTEEDFKKIRNYLELAYNNNFTNTKFYQNIVPGGIAYNGETMSSDIKFFDEGMKLNKLRMSKKSKGI